MERIKIQNFYGNNYNIEIKDRFLVIIGDNGERKSTLLRFIFFLVTKQFEKVCEFEFDDVSIDFINDSLNFNKKEYLEERDLFSIKEGLKDTIKHKFNEYENLIDRIFDYYKIENLLTNETLIEEIEFNEDVPKQLLLSVRAYVNEIINNKSKYSTNRIYDSLYLPTYRRIEKDYKTLFGDIDKRLFDYLKDLVEIKKDLKLSYISDKQYNNNETTIKTTIDLEELDFSNIVFDDNLSKDETVNNSFDESEIIKTQERDQLDDKDLFKKNIIGNLYSKLMDERNRERWSKNHRSSFTLEMIDFGIDDVIQRIMQFYQINTDNKDFLISNLQSFEKIIAKYITNFELKILPNKVEIIKNGLKISNINSLSSGEKQIISIFSYLIFEKQINKVVIIDEPEISLSLKWQEMILSDIRNLCDLLIVATHSPFIVKDEYFKNTKSIKDFLY